MSTARSEARKRGTVFDPTRPTLTPRQRRTVRQLARRVLAARGIETVMYADHLQASDGRTFGLDNLAATCLSSGLPEAHWDRVVEEHMGTLLSAFSTHPPKLTVDQLRAHTYLRLVPEAALPGDWTGDYSYAHRPGGGLLELLAHRDDDLVRWLRDEEVDLVGAAELRAIGRANLERVPVTDLETFTRQEIRFHVAHGDSGFIASKLLALPTVLTAAFGPDRTYPDGVLAAVPCRYQLAFAPVDADAMGAMAGLWSYAGWEHQRAPGPLSPFLYWWRDGALTQLSYLDPDGRSHLHHCPDLEAALDRLTPGGFAGYRQRATGTGDTRNGPRRLNGPRAADVGPPRGHW